MTLRLEDGLVEKFLGEQFGGYEFETPEVL